MTTVARPHALMFPFPFQGHVRPLMQLAHLLNHEHGFEVTFVNTSYIHKRLGLQDASTMDGDIHFLDLQEGFPDDYYTLVNFPELFVALAMLGPVMKKIVEKLVLDSRPITCIIADLDISIAQDTANHFGIPHVGFIPHGTASTSGEIYSSKIVEAGLLPLPPAQAGMPIEHGIRSATWAVSAKDAAALARPVTCVPGMYPLTVGELFSGILVRDIAHPVFQYFNVLQTNNLRQNAWTLVNTFHELEAPVIEALQEDAGIKLTTVGPLIITPTSHEDALKVDDKHSSRSSFWQEETKCLGWLDKQAPLSVIYVSFGSVTHLTTRDLEEFLRGLEDSQLPFLLVLREDLVIDPTTNNLQRFPPGFEERTKDRSLIVSWSPQLQVLGHPATAGFVSHCGWNSVLESMCLGVPMLGHPFFCDQAGNNRYIVSVWKTGLEFEGRTNMFVDRHEVAKKVRALAVKESSLRVSALKWKDAAKRSVQRGGSSSNNINAFATDMYKRAQAAAIPDSDKIAGVC